MRKHLSTFVLALVFLAAPVWGQSGVCSEQTTLRDKTCPAGTDCANKASTLTWAELDNNQANVAELCLESVNNVDGTGTANNAVCWTDSDTVQDCAAAIFNEAGADADFRVEGDTNANLIFGDASTDRVGIGTASPATKAHVLGGGSTVPTLNANTHLLVSSTNTAAASAIASIVSGNTGVTAVYFGDTDDENAGQLQYDHSTNELGIRVAADGDTLRVENNQVGVNTNDPASSLHVIGGLCVEASDTGCAAASGDLIVAGDADVATTGIVTLTVESTNDSQAGLRIEGGADWQMRTSGTWLLFEDAAGEDVLALKSATNEVATVGEMAVGDILSITPKATAPATCSIGDFYVDTSGAACACSATNTWSNMHATGSCV